MHTWQKGPVCHSEGSLTGSIAVVPPQGVDVGDSCEDDSLFAGVWPVLPVLPVRVRTVRTGRLRMVWTLPVRTFLY